MKITKKYNRLEKVIMEFSHSEVRDALHDYAQRRLGWTPKTAEASHPVLEWWDAEDDIEPDGSEHYLGCLLVYTYSHETEAPMATEGDDETAR